MSWSDRRRFLLSLGGLVLVAGCGFSPVYGPAGGAVGRLQGQVGLDAPSNRAGFDLAARLERLAVELEADPGLLIHGRARRPGPGER